MHEHRGWLAHMQTQMLKAKVSPIIHGEVFSALRVRFSTASQRAKLNPNRGGRISGLSFHCSSCEWESETAATRASGSLPGDLSKHQSTGSTSLTSFRFRRIIWSSSPGWPKSEGVSKLPPAFAPPPIPPVGPWLGGDLLQGGHQTTNLLWSCSSQEPRAGDPLHGFYTYFH